MNKSEILDKANNIISEKKYIETCIKANICPECGEELKSYRRDEISEWWDIVECPTNPNHYQTSKYDCFDDDDGGY
jgi:hypothetical protein